METELFAASAPGLEPIVEAELRALGFDARAEAGGAGWRGAARDLYRANLHLRTANRVLVRVARFRARSFIELERHARRIDWSPFLPPDSTVRLRVTSRKSRLYHERAIEERFARFLAEEAGAAPRAVRSAPGDDDQDSGDELRRTASRGAWPDPRGIAGDGPRDGAADNGWRPGGEGPSGDGPRGGVEDEGQLVVVRFLRDECLVSADASGALLHRRGYRRAVAKAPLRETLAAAMLTAVGWDGSVPIVDPFCGSGTIPIEAALIARRIAPGIASAELAPRAFAFERWPSFEAGTWSEVVVSARAEVRDATRHPIRGSDRDAGAIAAARANAERAGVADDVEFAERPISAASPPETTGRGLIVTNPPYGVRIGDPGPLRDLYAAFGRVMRERFPEWRAAVLAADDGLERFSGMGFEEVLRTRNGGIPVRLLVGG